VASTIYSYLAIPLLPFWAFMAYGEFYVCLFRHTSPVRALYVTIVLLAKVTMGTICSRGLIIHLRRHNVLFFKVASLNITNGIYYNLSSKKLGKMWR
jgi:hypothetical protein